MFVSPQNSYVEDLMPKLMVLGGGAFQMWSGHEGGGLMHRIHAFIKGYREKSSVCDLEEEPSLEPKHTGTLMSDFQLPELWEINFCSL